MSLQVIDSSVAIKWYVPEPHDAEALRLRTGGVALHCPDFLKIELAAILWKKIRRDGLPRSEADNILDDLAKIAVTWHPSDSLVPAAFNLADRTNRTVYDCLYLALAVQLDGVMITADEKLANALATTVWSRHVRKLQSIP